MEPLRPARCSRPMIGSAVKSASGASQPQVFTALCKLGRVLQEGGYSFVTPTPLTIERVNTRPENATARSLRDFFGWSCPAPPDLLPPAIASLGTSCGHPGRARVARREQGSVLDAFRDAVRAFRLSDIEPGFGFLRSGYLSLCWAHRTHDRRFGDAAAVNPRSGLRQRRRRHCGLLRRRKSPFRGAQRHQRGCPELGPCQRADGRHCCGHGRGGCLRGIRRVCAAKIRLDHCEPALSARSRSAFVPRRRRRIRRGTLAADFAGGTSAFGPAGSARALHRLGDCRRPRSLPRAGRAGRLGSAARL